MDELEKKIAWELHDEFDEILGGILLISSGMHGYMNAKGYPILTDPALPIALYIPGAIRVYTGMRKGKKIAEYKDYLVERMPRLKKYATTQAEFTRAAQGTFGALSILESGFACAIGYGIGYALGKYIL